MSHLPSNHKILIFALLVLLASCSRTGKPSANNAAPEKTVPMTFTTPSEAGAALLAAAQSGDQSAWLEIFGPGGTEILFTGDASQDAWGQIKAGGQTLYIGPDNYAFPIPLGQNSAGRWSFDTAAGRDEILARRIGKNELTAIEACEATANAQRHGQAVSTLGRLGDFGKAVTASSGDHPPLFNGYYYRILTKPGGFAVLAYPAEYRNSGIMTFIVAKDGTVYQKDLSEKTQNVARAMTEFNPADGWTPAMQNTGTASRAKQ